MRSWAIGAFKHITRMAVSAVALCLAGALTAQTPRPHVVQVPGTPVLSLGAFDAASVSYTMDEYFISGTAQSYKELSEPDAQGRWRVAPSETAPYVTRIVVVRPRHPAKFNGNVVVEWLNVSGGLDFGPVWNVTRRELLRSGTAYIALSAQRVGIEGGAGVLGTGGNALKQANPERYGRLSHPGDAFSYDILSQVGRLAKHGNGILGELKPRTVIAVGESQSAGYVTTYVNAVDPIAEVFDGFLIHSRFGSSAPLDPPTDRPSPMAAGQRPPRIVKMRSDLRVPVLMFETETDVLGASGGLGGFVEARQPDGPRLRAWEVAGTAHADAYFVRVGGIDSGRASIAELAAAYAPSFEMRGMKLEKAYNNAPQHHYIMQSALAHLLRWVNNGEAPPRGQPIATVGTGTPADPRRFILDAHGNARGGIRSPWVDVPIAKLSGIGPANSMVSRLYGSVEPFDTQKLEQLYPGGKPDYMAKFTKALDAAISAGFILPADRAEILALAEAGWPV